MKITNIELQRKKVDRVNIFVDGQFAFGISLALRFENKLEIGQEISDAGIRDLIEKDQVERLISKSMRFLSYRPRSEKEIRGQLLRKGKLLGMKGEEEISQYNQSVGKTIKTLKKLDQIDDTTFAKWWVEQRLRFKPMALNLIKRELLAKGVDRDSIEGVLKEVRGSKEDEEEILAMKAANKKLASYKKLEPKDFRVKMGQFLARKGFSWGIIKKTVDSFLGKRVE